MATTPIKIVTALTDALTKNGDGRRRPKPLGWIVVAVAVVIVAWGGWSAALDAATWVAKVNATSEHVEAHDAALKRIEGTVTRMDLRMERIETAIIDEGIRRRRRAEIER